MKEIVETHHYEHVTLRTKEHWALIPYLDSISPFPLDGAGESVLQPSEYTQNYFEGAESYGMFHRMIRLLQIVKPDSSFR